MSRQKAPICISDSDEEAQTARPPKSTKQPVLIDLTSDDDEEEEGDDRLPALEKKPVNTSSTASSSTLWPGAKSMVDRRASSNTSRPSPPVTVSKHGQANNNPLSLREGSPAAVKFTPPSPNHMDNRIQLMNELASKSAAKPDSQIPSMVPQHRVPPDEIPTTGMPKAVSPLPKLGSPKRSASRSDFQAPRGQDISQQATVTRQNLISQPKRVPPPFGSYKPEAIESSFRSEELVERPLMDSKSKHSANSSPQKSNTMPNGFFAHLSNGQVSPEKESRDLESQVSSSSIRSASPLIQRLKQKGSSTRSMESHKVSMQEMESILATCYVDLKDDVALTTRAFLEEAKETCRNASKDFIDKASPWKLVKALPHSADFVPAGVATTKIETILYGNANTHKSKSSRRIIVASKTIKDLQPRVPSYTAITLAKRNILTADNEVLKSMPFLGQSDAEHKGLLKELVAHHSEIKLTNIVSERASQIGLYLDSWLADLSNISFSEQILQRFVLQQGCAGKNRDLYRSILKSLGGDLPSEVSRTAADFDRAFQTIFGLDLSDVVLPESHLKSLAQKLKPVSEPTPSGQAMFTTFSDFLCLVCGLAYCQIHGDYNLNPINQIDENNSQIGDVKYEYDYQPLGNCYTDLVRKHEVRTLTTEPDSEFKDNQDMVPCSKTCYLSDDVEDVYEPWSRELCNTLKEFLRVFVNLDDQACNISFALNVPCWQANREIRKCAKQPNRIPKKHTTSDRPKWYNNEKKTLSSRWEDETEVHNHENARQINPCAHEGPCSSSDCSCFEDNILCERMCGCSDNCGRRFTGCNCVPDVQGVCCTLDSCICLQMNRECGPECLSCCALDRINPQNKHNDDLFTTGCQNVVMQRGVPKRLVIGESTLVGFGAYLAEPAKKGDYLGDYVGEVISFTESERRALIYERKDSSFLFDLNNDWTIDAAKQGNKTRFINHANTEQTGQNCSAKVLLVNGEHRIKFLALRDIKPGEELLFNYGKKFANEHFKKALGTTQKDKNMVLTGDDLDILDGFKPASKDLKKKTALRDSRSSQGKGRGKARKTALKRSDTLLEEVGDPISSSFERGTEVKDSDAEDEEEEVEDEELVRGRPKRKTRRPSRYTR